MVNKGLEVIEAHWLYNMPYEQIKVLVHPESIVHSLVEYVDGSVLAQLAIPDMRIPIQFALTYPERCSLDLPKLDLAKLAKLTFFEPDMEVFRGLPLAYQVGKIGGTAPCIFNAANEVAVEAFLKGKIKFLDIYDTIEYALDKIPIEHKINSEVLYVTDSKVREITGAYLKTR